MLFVGQIEVDPRMFGGPAGRLAYIFVEGPDPLTARVGFHWHENAVIIQPGPSCIPSSRPLTEGPSVCCLGKGKRRWLFRERIAIPCEFAVEMESCEEPEIDWEEDDSLAEFPFDIEQSKIGGQALWIQGDGWPYDQPTPLLLQLVWGSFPFHLDLGDAGTLYVCLSPDGREARIVWQCY